MKKVVYIIIIILCSILSIYIAYSLLRDDNKKLEPVNIIKYENNINKENKNNSTNINKQEIQHNKLMIVAHPDDDTIFGGAHLIQDKYTVVCVTCGVVKYRLNEFIKAMAFSEDDYKYLSHTDIEPSGYISNWTKEKETIREELKSIIDSKDWDVIVTHNPDGEYGHKHHKMVNKIVTESVSDKSKLYYFGIYHKKGTVDNSPALEEELYAKKRKMLDIYKSQSACSNNSHLVNSFTHENWIKYSDWK